MLCGNVIALLLPVPVAWIITMLTGPDDYDFNLFKQEIKTVGETDDELVKTADGEVAVTKKSDIPEMEEEELEDASRFALMSSWIGTIIMIVIWPLPLFFSNYVFDLDFFRGWVSLSIIWVWCAIAAVVVYPIYENLDTISMVLNAMTGNAPPNKAEERVIYEQK
jgi:hypothetical protein